MLRHQKMCQKTLRNVLLGVLGLVMGGIIIEAIQTSIRQVTSA